MPDLIGVEEHFISQATQAAASAPKPDRPQTGSVLPPVVGRAIAGGLAQYDADAQLTESATKRIAFMDAHNMQMQVLSDSGLENTSAVVAIPQARAMNDELIALTNTYPDRFAGFAALPLQDPEAAAAELRRTVKQGLRGTMIHGRIGGKWLDDPEFKPLWAAAEEMDVPVYIHPAIIDSTVMQHYYLSNQYSSATGGALGLPGFGWHAETGLEFVRMLLARRFDEFPNLKIMMGHWGELVSFYMHRLDETIMPTHPDLKHDVSDYFHRNLYVSPSGMFNQNQLNWAIAEFGAQHVMFSTDYPYEPVDKIGTFLTDSALSKSDQTQVASRTVKRLMHL